MEQRISDIEDGAGELQTSSHSLEQIIQALHCLGMLQPEKQGARPTIAKYLNYAEKAQILQRFRLRRELIIEGHPILVFADYSPEVSRKRKAYGK